ncbi:hypothetical protein [Thiolapillus sp.]
MPGVWLPHCLILALLLVAGSFSFAQQAGSPKGKVSSAALAEHPANTGQSLSSSSSVHTTTAEKALPSLEPALVFHDLSAANDQVLKYARLKKDEQGEPLALQTAVVRMVPGKGGPDIEYVDLIGAVHIGEHHYYQQINGLFRQYDVVLYELVAPKGTRIPRGGGKNHSIIGNLQSGMRKVLGLGLQLEDVDYHLPNLVHADLTPDEFFESMAKRNESIAGMIGKAWLAGMGRQRSSRALLNQVELYRNLLAGDSDKALKIWFASEMVDMNTMQRAIEGQNGSTLLAARNRKAVQVLRGEISKGHRRIGIFYGAAHLSGIQKLLQKDLGLVPAQVAWLEAWDLR